MYAKCLSWYGNTIYTVLTNQIPEYRLGRTVGRTKEVNHKMKKQEKTNKQFDNLGEDYIKEYSPEKAYPQLRNATWRELEKPGKVRYLTREEIEAEYDLRTCTLKSST